MSDFSDRPFVAGSLIGLRAFDVDKYGRLIGPSQGGVFRPGMNEGRCIGARAGWLLPEGAEVEWVATFSAFRTGGNYVVTLADGERLVLTPREISSQFPNEEHVVGSADCSCGYYAYFDGRNDYEREGRVSALIEGSGVCTVGDRGFRASKARLVALIRPEPEKVKPEPTPVAWWRRALRSNWLNVAALIMMLGVAALNAVTGNWVAVGTAAAWASVISFSLINDRRDQKRVERLKSDLAMFKMPSLPGLDDPRPVDWSLLQQNYPDVPIYPSIKAALTAHPLTPPPAPTPEDEDFWTREVTA